MTRDPGFAAKARTASPAALGRLPSGMVEQVNGADRRREPRPSTSGRSLPLLVVKTDNVWQVCPQ
jgi:hypothetical protein